ncbi:MAG: hypothetical protein WBD72_16500, partial [Candidatus Acidiferrum sp.]
LPQWVFPKPTDATQDRPKEEHAYARHEHQSEKDPGCFEKPQKLFPLGLDCPLYFVLELSFHLTPDPFHF